MPVSSSAPLLGVASRGGVASAPTGRGEGVRRWSLLSRGCGTVGNKEGVDGLARRGRGRGAMDAVRSVGKAAIVRLVAMFRVFRFCFALSR